VKNIKSLIDAIEFVAEVEELKDLGLTDEEIEGFIQMFCESWVEFETIKIMRGIDDKNSRRNN